MDHSDKGKRNDIGDQSFEELLKGSDTARRRFKKGEKVTATVVGVTPEWIFIDMGGKSEGVLAREEFVDDAGDITIQEGDSMTAYFIEARGGEYRFTTCIDGEAGRFYLEDAWQGGIPVEGYVEKEIKGGYEVRIAGKHRAFCPFSQMGMPGEGAPEDIVGTRQQFKIVEYGEEGKNIIISNRMIREEEREQKQEELKKTLREGMTVDGTVVSLPDFGAFVDIGGIQGLVPLSEIGWKRIDKSDDVLSVGQRVTVVVKEIDWEKNRLTLSIKDTLPDPWECVKEHYINGSRHTGEIVRLAKFGAFVTLDDGVDGLIHISKIGTGRKINHPKDVYETGQKIDVEIESVDAEKRRIGLVPVEYADEKAEADAGEYRGYVETGSRSMGTLGDLLKQKKQKGRKNTSG